MIEDKTTEFKREFTNNIKYAIIALANTEGGKIYIGLNDDGSVVGVKNVDETLLQLTNIIRDNIKPDITLFIDYSVENIENKNVIIVNVQRGTARPYYLQGKGIRPEGVYVRQGASSVPASDALILNMIKETSGDSYENARSLNQNLTFEKAKEYFEKKGLKFEESQMRTLHLISEDGTYSNLGMLLSDQCIHTIKMAVFEGSKKTIFKDKKDLSGSLLQQMEDAYAFINQYNRTHSDFIELDRIDKRDYPPEALREALLNAIVHRDYSISSSTLIRIFDDRIEFTTIGGLTKGLSFDDLMLGVSVLRNEKLANVFYRLRLIEAYGTGLLKINECYEDEVIKPRIEVSNNAFKITLPNINYKSTNTVQKKEEVNKKPKLSREEAIIKFTEENTSISRKDIEKLLNVSQATAILIIRDLLKKGTLLKENNGKNSIYKLNKSLK